MIESMLTTTDNPFSPFDEFEAWFAYDVRSGYHTPSYLARVLVSSTELSQADQALAMEEAIDRIEEWLFNFHLISDCVGYIHRHCGI